MIFVRADMAKLRAIKECFEVTYDDARKHVPLTEHNGCGSFHWRIAHGFFRSRPLHQRKLEDAYRSISLKRDAVLVCTVLAGLAALYLALLAWSYWMFETRSASVGVFLFAILAVTVAIGSLSALQKLKVEQEAVRLALIFILDADTEMAIAMREGDRARLENVLSLLAGESVDGPPGFATGRIAEFYADSLFGSAKKPHATANA